MKADKPSAEERAERLRVLLSVSAWLPDGRHEAIKQLSDEDLLTLDGLCDEDLALANACFAVEAERRARAFAALEKLIAVIGTVGEGRTVEDRVCALPKPEFTKAARLVLDLGWVDQ